MRLNSNGQAYFVHEDGTSRWGINVLLHGVPGIPTSRKMHEAPVEVRRKFYANALALKQKLEAKRVEAESAKKKSEDAIHRG